MKRNAAITLSNLFLSLGKPFIGTHTSGMRMWVMWELFPLTEPLVVQPGGPSVPTKTPAGAYAGPYWGN